jgi:hypothetical protein
VIAEPEPTPPPPAARVETAPAFALAPAPAAPVQASLIPDDTQARTAAAEPSANPFADHTPEALDLAPPAEAAQLEAVADLVEAMPEGLLAEAINEPVVVPPAHEWTLEHPDEPPQAGKAG